MTTGKPDRPTPEAMSTSLTARRTTSRRDGLHQLRGELQRPGCQLEWVPNSNHETVSLGLKYGGIGTANEVIIGSVLLRVSHDG